MKYGKTEGRNKHRFDKQVNKDIVYKVCKTDHRCKDSNAHATIVWVEYKYLQVVIAFILHVSPSNSPMSHVGVYTTLGGRDVSTNTLYRKWTYLAVTWGRQGPRVPPFLSEETRSIRLSSSVSSQCEPPLSESTRVTRVGYSGLEACLYESTHDPCLGEDRTMEALS